MSAIQHPASPLSYANRILHPRPNGTVHDRLICSLLNELNQPGLAPYPKTTDFFSPVGLTNTIYLRIYPDDAEGITSVGLDTVLAPAQVQNLRIQIQTTKKVPAPDSGAQAIAYYEIKAWAICHDILTDVTILEGGRPAQVCIVMQWSVVTFDARQNSRDCDELPFERIVQLLKRTGKRNYNSYGELRDEAEKKRLDGQLDGGLVGWCEIASGDMETELEKAFEN